MESENPEKRFSDLDFKFTMEPETQAIIMRDFGIFYKRRDLLKLAESMFDEALLGNPECFRSMYEKSRCQLESGNPNVALVSAEQCIEHFPNKNLAHRHRNACLFEQNEFEESLLRIAQTRHTFPDVTREDDWEVVLPIIEETIGTSKGSCLLNMRKDIEKYDVYRKSNKFDDRPLWKVLREKGQCDVVSVLEKPKTTMSKIKHFRDERKKNNMHIMYMGLQTSKDILFLEQLEKDKRLMLPQTHSFNTKVGDIISRALKEVRDYENMLRHRQPVYAAQDAERRKVQQKYAEIGLTRLQAKTRREAFAQLVEIKRLAAGTDMVALRIYVEKVLNKFYSIKTNRLFPRKFQFISEIFNMVGLAYLRNSVKIPINVRTHPVKEQLLALFQIPYEKKADEPIDKREHFGDKRFFVDPTAKETGFLTYKQRADILDRDMQLCRYPIHGCYICYELAHLHMAHGNMEEPKQLANKMLAYAEKCGNLVWQFLGLLTAARADMASGQVIGCEQRMQSMNRMLKSFDEMTGHFVQTALVMLGYRRGNRFE